jgi:Ca2+-binding RTX toxin-like protein
MANINFPTHSGWASTVLFDVNGDGYYGLPGVAVDPDKLTENGSSLYLDISGSAYYDHISLSYSLQGGAVTLQHITYTKDVGDNAMATVFSLANLNVTVPVSTLNGSTWTIPIMSSNDIVYGSGSSDFISGGTGTDDVWGWASDDYLDGGSGDDNLKGGAGNDVLVGGEGFDTADYTGKVKASLTFYKNLDGSVSVTDVGVLGAPATEGTDTLWGIEYVRYEEGVFALSSVAKFYSIWGDASKNRIVGTNEADSLWGKNGNDIILGLNGDDRIYGGTGKDTLTGGKGKDAFIFDTKPSKTNVDKITDFSVKYDSIYLEGSLFNLPFGFDASVENPAKVKKGYFTVGSKAKDYNDVLIYDDKSGKLYYDADGINKIKQVEIATLSKGLKMTAADFFVI